jgi:ubiquinone/menaquinone biosynthesis C-methylase UbiE
MAEALTSPPPPRKLKSRLKESYDAIAPRYNEWTASTNLGTRITYLEKLLERLPLSKHHISVLELGCGAGIPVTQKLLSYPNISVTANDISSTQIALAKQNLAKEVAANRVHFIESDMMTFNLPIQAFNAILSIYSIIHLPREEQKILIQRIAKWLKPGGIFLANFTKEDMPGSEMEKWLGEEKGWMYWSGWGVERTVEIVEKAGLEVLVRDVHGDLVDAEFLWLLARKKAVVDE